MLKVVFLPCLSSLNPSDVTETDDGTRENSKSAPSEDSLTHPEAEVPGEAEPELMADSEPEVEPEPEDEPEVQPEPEGETMAETEPELDPEGDADDPELDEEADPEAAEETEPDETEQAENEVDMVTSSKEAEDDHLSVSIQNEDAITLDVDGDDLLETGKHVKLPDPDADKGTDEPGSSAEMGPDDDTKPEKMEGKKDDGSKGEATKKEGREATKRAESGDKEKDSGKKGPSATGAGQAKRFVFLCQFFDTTTKSSSLRTQLCGLASRIFFFALRGMFSDVPNPPIYCIVYFTEVG